MVELAQPTGIATTRRRAAAVAAVVCLGLVAWAFMSRWAASADVPVVLVALLVVRYTCLLVGMITAGLLLLRCLSKPGHSVGFDHLGRATAHWAWLWALVSLMWLVVTASKVTGITNITTAVAVVDSTTLSLVAGSKGATLPFATLWVALLVAMLGTGRPRADTAGAAILALAAVVPNAWIAGPSGHHGGQGSLRTAAVVAIAVLLVAGATWLGGVLAIVVYLRKFPSALALTVPRFKAAAAAAGLLVGLAGVSLTALDLAGPSTLWATNAGQTVVGAGLLTLLLTFVGLRHRDRAVHLASRGGGEALIGFAAGEVVLMGAIVLTAYVLSMAA